MAEVPQVTRENFQEVLPAVKQALQACEYYAFDCEMTGLFANDNQQNYLDELEDRYAQASASIPTDSQSYPIPILPVKAGLSQREHTGIVGH